MSSISCACVYLCTCLCMCRHVLDDVFMETKGQPQPLGLFSRHCIFVFFHFFFWNGTVTSLEINQSANQTDQWYPGIYLYLFSQSWDYKCIPPELCFWFWCLFICVLVLNSSPPACKASAFLTELTTPLPFAFNYWWINYLIW